MTPTYLDSDCRVASTHTTIPPKAARHGGLEQLQEMVHIDLSVKQLSQNVQIEQTIVTILCKIQIHLLKM